MFLRAWLCRDKTRLCRDKENRIVMNNGPAVFMGGVLSSHCREHEAPLETRHPVDGSEAEVANQADGGIVGREQAVQRVGGGQHQRSGRAAGGLVGGRFIRSAGVRCFSSRLVGIKLRGCRPRFRPWPAIGRTKAISAKPRGAIACGVHGRERIGPAPPHELDRAEKRS